MNGSSPRARPVRFDPGIALQRAVHGIERCWLRTAATVVFAGAPAFAVERTTDTSVSRPPRPRGIARFDRSPWVPDTRDADDHEAVRPGSGPPPVRVGLARPGRRRERPRGRRGLPRRCRRAPALRSRAPPRRRVPDGAAPTDGSLRESGVELGEDTVETRCRSTRSRSTVGTVRSASSKPRTIRSRLRDCRGDRLRTI